MIGRCHIACSSDPAVGALRVQQVEYNDPMLTVVGHGCSVALIGEWTWYRSDQVVTVGGDAGAEDIIWDLCGLDLLEILFPDSGFDADCVFVLSDGRIEARSDQSGFEMCTFRHEAIDTVLVGL